MMVVVLFYSESYESDVVVGIYRDLETLKASNPEITWWDEIDGGTLAEQRRDTGPIVADGQLGSVYSHYFAQEWEVR